MMPSSHRLVRKPLRARDHDYANAGLCFVTICAHHMETRFGTVDSTGVVLNGAGRDIEMLWDGIPERHPGVRLDIHVVMPNHIHGIVMLGTDPGSTPPSLSVIVGQFKSMTTAVYGRGVRSGTYPPFDRSLWQRGFHDHIVRNEQSLEEVRRYIQGNPARWWERRRQA